MLRACSHLVLASPDVPRITRFFSDAFDIAPRFANEMFAEFVLPSAFRIAFFKPAGSSAQTFDASADRRGSAIGITVEDVNRFHAGVADRYAPYLSGPPKEHPWGERSLLLTDPDGNRWEVTQSPSTTGMLIDR
jgi:hypothetical protein